MSVSAGRVRRIARAVVVGVSATLLAACGTDDTSEPRAEEPTIEETPSETPTAEEPAALDPCALLDAEAVSQTLDGEELRVTSRHATPSEAGWETVCGYGTILGSYTVSLTVSSEVDPTTFPEGSKDGENPAEGKDGEPGELQPIEDLGDAAWTEVAVPPPGYASGSVRVHILRGDHALRISTNYRAEDKPNVDGTVELGRAALTELPAEFTIPPFELESPCADIDTGLAAEAIGDEIVSGRSLVEGADVACEFALTDGFFSVWAIHGEDAVRMFEEGPTSGDPVDGLGEDAFSLGDGIGSLHVRRGDQVVSVSAFSGGSPPPAQLTDQQVALVESILAALSVKIMLGR